MRKVQKRKLVDLPLMLAVSPLLSLQHFEDSFFLWRNAILLVPVMLFSACVRRGG